MRTVSEHLKNIFASEELTEEATLRNFRTVQTEGSREVSRNVAFYNLDAIIAVGFGRNTALDATLAAYQKLIGENSKFSTFTSSDVVRAAEMDADDNLREWIVWYRELYRV